MTADASIDPARFLSEQLDRAAPDLLRSLLKTFVDALMAAEADAVCGAPYGETVTGSGELPQRVPAAGVGHPGGHARVGDSEASDRVVLPGLAAGAAPPSRACPDHGGDDLLPARGVDPADGASGGDPRPHQVVQVADVGDVRGARRSGRVNGG